MFKRRSLVAVPVTLAALIAATFTNIQTASAEEGKCPAGFGLVTSLNLHDSKGKVGPGKIQIWGNHSKNQNCAIVQRNGPANGVKGNTAVSLQPAGKEKKSNSGNFEYFAGPVIHSASGCTTLSGYLTYKGVKYGLTRTGWCNSGDTTPGGGSGDGPRFVTPIKGLRGGDSYGDLGAGRTVPHRGIDFAASCGTPVRAVHDGTLRKQSGVSWSGIYLITVTASDGTVTRYAHMQSFSVANGRKVQAGQKIGAVGNKGNSRGCHLHFEVSPNGNGTSNPRPWLDKLIKNFNI